MGGDKRRGGGRGGAAVGQSWHGAKRKPPFFGAQNSK